MTAILTAAVRVKDETTRRFPSPNRHGKCFHNQFHGDAFIHRPPHDTTEVEIDDHSKTQPPSSVQRQVMSPTQTQFGVATENLRLRRLGATGNVCLLSVVTLTVHCVRAVGKMGLPPRDEGPGHIEHNLDHLLDLAFMGDQMLLEGFQGFFAFARGGPNHRFFVLVKVDKQDDIAVSGPLRDLVASRLKALRLLRSMATLAVLT